MLDSIERLTDANIASALQGFYAPAKPSQASLDQQQLIELLEGLPALSVEEHVDPILIQIDKFHRGTIISREDRALLAYIDDCVTQILAQTDLDYKIEAFVRDLSPFIAVIALRDGVKSVFEPQPILNLIDTLIREGLGWSEDLGVLGEQFMDKIAQQVRDMVTKRTSLAECQAELASLFAKEEPLFQKMEKRLLDVEMRVLAGQRARHHTAEFLNREMINKQLPLFILFALQGSWYDFLQAVFKNHGESGDYWPRACALTRDLIWSFQPQEDTDKLQAVMARLPQQINDLCAELDFDTDTVIACLADFEAEHDAIRAGSPSDPCDFDPISIDSSNKDVMQTLSEEAKADILALSPGQWYLYDDKDDPDEKVARIKLILNWDETLRLLFTNHNRRKVMHMTYAEFAQNMAQGTLKPLSPKASTWEIIKSHLATIVQGVRSQKQREVTVEDTDEKRKLTQTYLLKRKQEIVAALKERRRIGRMKQKRALLLREKAQRKLDAATAAIESLRPDAWLMLPVMEGTLTPCKLVAIIPGNENYIFANRNGLKVGEFTKSQLVYMLIAENSEILDTGAEFESVLATVVSALRENRNKSFDELTGATA